MSESLFFLFKVTITNTSHKRSFVNVLHCSEETLYLKMKIINSHLSPNTSILIDKIGTPTSTTFKYLYKPRIKLRTSTYYYEARQMILDIP